jgi:hypothetical protein
MKVVVEKGGNSTAFVGESGRAKAFQGNDAHG